MPAEHDLLALVDELEDLIGDAAHIPLTGRVIVEAEKVYALLDRLRAAIPEGMQQAQRVMRDRERMLAEARSEADAIVREAQGYAAKLTEDSAIVQRAQEEAAKIVEEARRQGREVRLAARQYTGELLEKVQANLHRCLTVVQEGLEELGPPLPREDGHGNEGAGRAK